MSQSDQPSDQPSPGARTTPEPSPGLPNVPLGGASQDAYPEREANDPVYPEAYYEYLERAFGPEKAAWARLPRAQRMHELKKIHQQYKTPDDLDPIPPELGGGVWNP